MRAGQQSRPKTKVAEHRSIPPRLRPRCYYGRCACTSPVPMPWRRSSRRQGPKALRHGRLRAWALASGMHLPLAADCQSDAARTVAPVVPASTRGAWLPAPGPPTPTARGEHHRAGGGNQGRAPADREAPPPRRRAPLAGSMSPVRPARPPGVFVQASLPPAAARPPPRRGSPSGPSARLRHPLAPGGGAVAPGRSPPAPGSATPSRRRGPRCRRSLSPGVFRKHVEFDALA